MYCLYLERDIPACICTSILFVFIIARPMFFLVVAGTDVLSSIHISCNGKVYFMDVAACGRGLFVDSDTGGCLAAVLASEQVV